MCPGSPGARGGGTPRYGRSLEASRRCFEPCGCVPRDSGAPVSPLRHAVSLIHVFQAQDGGGAKKTATRLTAEQKAVLQEAFAANPRPSVADRKQLAAQLHIESATCDRWFAAERDRQGVPKLQGRGRPPAQGAADVAPADGAPSAAAPMAPTRKRKAAYEVPTDEAGFAQLLVAVDSEVTALQALAAPPAHWFAHLQATPAPPLGPGPQLQCAVRDTQREGGAQAQERRAQCLSVESSHLKRRPPGRCELALTQPVRVSWPHRWLP